MPLGAPAIPGVRALQLRDVQVAIDRIRERFQAIESQLTATTAQAGQSTLTLGQSNASISNLQRQLSALVSRVDAIDAPTDKLETFTAAAAIEQYDPVYVTTAGFVSPARPTEPDAIYGVIGVATTAAALGASVVVRKSGTMQIAGAAFQAGGPVYAGLDGLTQFPDYVGVAVPVGVAVGTDQIDVAPGWPALQYPDVYSEFETFLPATWGLVRDAVQLTDDFNAVASGIVVKTGFDDVSTRTLQQPAAGITITNPAGTGGDPTFALVNDLAALEGLSSTGIAVRTATDSWAQRSVVGTADRVTVTNGSGVAGDPAVDIASTYVGQTSITTLGTVATGVWQGTAVGATFGGTAQTTWAAGDLLYASAANTLSKRTIGSTGDVLTVSGGVPVWTPPATSGTVTSVNITQPAAGITATGGPITSSGSITLALANDLAAVEGLGSTGIAVRTATDTWAVRTLQQPVAGITITNQGGVAGDPTFALANDLAAVEGLSSAGFAVRRAIDAWEIRSIAGTSGRIQVTDGDGVLGNPIIDISASYVGQTSITTLGTVTTGTWSASTIAANRGGTGVANASGSTITLGGALTLSGAFTTTLTVTANTSVTLPTSGTLATTAQLPTGANPTASVGLTAVNGSASTLMRSDGAPALSQSISPTWTGNHTFAPDSGNTVVTAGNFGIGTSNPQRAFHVTTTFSNTGTAAAFENANTADNSGPVFSFRTTTTGPGASTFVEVAAFRSVFTVHDHATRAARFDILASRAGTFKTARLTEDGHWCLIEDNQELRLGTGNDLRLYHDGTDSYSRNDTGRMRFSAGATVQAQYDTTYFEQTTQVRKSATISPAQITSNQNDYNPTSLSTAYRLRINSDAARDITGLQGGADGRELFVTNTGSFSITLKNESASSSAANRFSTGADVILGSNVSVLLQYDGTSSRWRAA